LEVKRKGQDIDDHWFLKFIDFVAQKNKKINGDEFKRLRNEQRSLYNDKKWDDYERKVDERVKLEEQNMEALLN